MSRIGASFYSKVKLLTLLFAVLLLLKGTFAENSLDGKTSTVPSKEGAGILLNKSHFELPATGNETTGNSTAIQPPASNGHLAEKLNKATPSYTETLETSSTPKAIKNQPPAVTPENTTPTPASTRPTHATDSSILGDSKSVKNREKETTSQPSVKSSTASTPLRETAQKNVSDSTEIPSRKNIANSSSSNEDSFGENVSSDKRESSNDSRFPLCKNDGDCNKTAHTQCNVSSGSCSCMAGYSRMSPGVCGKKLGDICEGHCDAQNSLCYLQNDKQICICEDGLTASKDGTFCYGPPLIYGDVCESSDNCTMLGQHVECKKHSCRCKDNYVRWDGACKEKIDHLDKECNVSTQICYDEAEADMEARRECVGGFCRCMKTFVPHNGMCKEKIRLLGAPCNSSKHVCHIEDGFSQKVECLNGMCQCKKEYLLNEGKCKRRIDTLGEKCSSEVDVCYRFEESYDPKRQCINGTCHCKSGYIESNKLCKQKIRLLGATCNATTEICWLDDSDPQITHCRDGMCQCKPEYELQNRKCTTKSISGTFNLVPSIRILFISFIFKILR